MKLILLLALLFLTCGFVLVLRNPALAQENQPENLINPDRPGIADGSAVINPGSFQIELGVERDSRKNEGSAETSLFTPTLLRYGISDQWEARVEGNMFTWTKTSDPVSGTTSSFGLSPVSVGFKYHFHDQDKVGGSPSLGTIFRFFPPTETGGFQTNHATADLRLAADWDFTPKLSLNPNIGIAYYEDGDGNLFTSGLFALTLNYWPTKTFNPFLDMGIQSPEERSGKTSLIVDGGIAWICAPSLQLDFSLGTGAYGKTPPRPFVAAGISVRM